MLSIPERGEKSMLPCEACRRWKNVQKMHPHKHTMKTYQQHSKKISSTHKQKMGMSSTKNFSKIKTLFYTKCFPTSTPLCCKKGAGRTLSKIRARKSPKIYIEEPFRKKNETWTGLGWHYNHAAQVSTMCFFYIPCLKEVPTEVPPGLIKKLIQRLSVRCVEINLLVSQSVRTTIGNLTQQVSCTQNLGIKKRELINLQGCPVTRTHSN